MQKGRKSPVGWGFLSGALAMVAAHAIYWFIGGPGDASTTRTVLVWVQLLGAAAVAVWAWRRGKELARESQPTREATGA